MQGVLGNGRHVNGRTKARMSSRRVEPQNSVIPDQNSIIPEVASKKQTNDRGKEQVSGGNKEKEASGKLTLQSDSLGLSHQTIKAVGKAKTTKGRKKAGGAAAKVSFREESSSTWAAKLLKTVESLETDDPSSHLQSPESEPAAGILGTVGPKQTDAEVIVNNCIDSTPQKFPESLVPPLSEPTTTVLQKLSRKRISIPTVGQGLPQEFKRLLQIFSQVESALPILLSRRSTPHMSVEILARHLDLDVNEFITLLRKINGVWPEAVWLCWSDDQPEGNFSTITTDFKAESRWNLQIGKGGIGDPSQLPSQRIGVSKHSLTLVELRKSQFEAKLAELAQTKRGIPLSKLPQIPAATSKPRQETQKVKDFLSADESNTRLRQLQLEKRIKELSESGFAQEPQTRTEGLPGLDQMTQNSLSFLHKARKSPIPHEIHNTNTKESQSTQDSAFLQSITEMIREKEEKIKAAKEKYDTNAGHSKYSFEELSQSVASIKMAYTERQVSNLFLAQLIEKLSKATFKTISSGETCAKLEHIIEITRPWLTVVPRIEGALVRIDHKIPVPQIIASLRQQPTPVKLC